METTEIIEALAGHGPLVLMSIMLSMINISELVAMICLHRKIEKLEENLMSHLGIPGNGNENGNQKESIFPDS